MAAADAPTFAGEDSAVTDGPVLQISNLSRRFGNKLALDSVSLVMPRGAVYGLVGANGAGKTTLIRHILGLLAAESGSVSVFGLDPVADPVGVLSRIGYLSEENDLPGWMRVDELIRYSRAFYPKWDDAYAEELRVAFASTARRASKRSRRDRRRAPACSSRWRIAPSSSCSTNRRRDSIRSCDATSSA